MSNYHHGDLYRSLLSQAGVMAAELGPEAITLRELARRTGVSHSAPVYHFSTRRGLLTALAAQGFEQLHASLLDHTADIFTMGVAYVRWALDNPGRYAVMWQPSILDESQEVLSDARRRAWDLLSATVADAQGGGQKGSQVSVDAYAAFALVHGLASIWLSGALPRPDDPTEMTLLITRRLAISG